MEIQYILKHLWKYANSYRLSTGPNADQSESYWYIQDEVGSHLQHSDDPNCEVYSFIFCKDLMDLQDPSKGAVLDPSSRITYSIMWPKKKIEKDAILSRNFLPNIDEKMYRSARL
mmetsp:Transcript_38215/g.37717  ORF Transcript_38215/g.37717 Transcript_38215/m.37717 type:complete len:115 (+) Transcript_38215:228-572(+)